MNPSRPAPPRQQGFSMVELLMAAVILAIGILGLAMLQTYTFAAQHGNSSLSTAIQVAQQVLDQAEMVGRNSVICSQSGTAQPTLTTTYSGATQVKAYFNYSGQPVTTGPYYTAVLTANTAASSAPGVVVPVSKFGGIALMQVVVTWTEGFGPGNKAVTRNVTLNRRINYATS